MIPATTKQVAFITSLASERNVTINTIGMTAQEASRTIGDLLKTPKATMIVLPVGIYQTADGSVYKVQKAKFSEGFYAKKLTPIRGDRLNEKDVIVHWTFKYATGAIKALKLTDKVTLEQAKAFGIKYGVCMVCGATLEDPKSIANGIGPVCGKKV